MNLKEKSVCLLIRSRGRFFSIERIFQQLGGELSRHIRVNRWEAEHASPRHLIANLLSIRKVRSDVFHITGDIHYMALALSRRRTLLTIHDCIFLYSSKGIKRSILKWLFLDMPVRRAALITTISDHTREDILRHTRCPADKIVVIPNPVDNNIRYEPAVFREAEPVILFVGSTPNKNLERVAAALEGISCKLVIVGVVPDDTSRSLRERNIQFNVRSGLTDGEMAAQYTAADMILFPSTFEGFGLPILEGQKAGRPVVTSDLGPMKQVAAGAACLVDPYDIASIREGVLKVIGDKEYRERLVVAGLENAACFTPEKIALRYIDCYRKLLED